MGEVNDKYTRDKVVLAALLHDIGKFWQRADRRNYAQVVESINLQEPDTIVPVYENGHPKYQHAIWTQAFFEKYVNPKLPNEWRDGLDVKTLSSKHHKPSNTLEGIISLADKWSSGIDRPDEGEESRSGYEWAKDTFGNSFVKKVPLHSIFDRIKVEGKDNIDSPNYFKLNSLDIKDDVFPEDDPSNYKRSKEDDYESLWNGFIRDFEKIEFVNSDQYFNTVLTILKKYTWCIPAGTNVEYCTASLFEHLKTTAGIAISLYDHHFENKGQWTENEYHQVKPSEDTDPLIMVCLDLSGIQNFIYNITSKGAAKALKGRSFYLELLMISATKDLLYDKKINANSCNVIYNSGGKCYLVLPNIERVKDALFDFERKVQESFFEKYREELYLCIGWCAFRYETIFDQKSNKWENSIRSGDPKIDLPADIERFDLGLLWRAVSDEAAKKKSERFAYLIERDFEKYFNPITYDHENTALCSATGVRDQTDKLIEIEGSDPPQLVSPLVREQIDLGKRMKSVERIEEFTDNVGGVKPGNFGRTYKVFQNRDSWQTGATNIYVNHFPSDKNTLNEKISVMFYGGNKQPLQKEGNEEVPKTYGDIVKLDDKKRTKLGVLRMDVDNLGKIFIQGLDNQLKTFANYATLSMLLDWFFSGYLNKIRDEKYSDDIIINYSGGDDIFAVGRWDACIEFAKDVREKFREFVGRNDISISAGLAIVDAKYPIRKAAEIAGDAETAAKNYERKNGQRKNAFSLFDQEIGWEEFSFVENNKFKLVKYTNEGAISKGLLHKLQSFWVSKDSNQNSFLNMNSPQKDYRYKWQAAYYLSRALKNGGSDNYLKEIRDGIIHHELGADRYLDLICIAARWAEYEIRFNN